MALQAHLSLPAGHRAKLFLLKHVGFQLVSRLNVALEGLSLCFELDRPVDLIAPQPGAAPGVLATPCEFLAPMPSGRLRCGLVQSADFLVPQPSAAPAESCCATSGAMLLSWPAALRCPSAAVTLVQISCAAVVAGRVVSCCGLLPAEAHACSGTSCLTVLSCLAANKLLVCSGPTATMAPIIKDFASVMRSDCNVEAWTLVYRT